MYEALTFEGPCFLSYGQKRIFFGVISCCPLVASDEIMACLHFDYQTLVLLDVFAENLSWLWLKRLSRILFLPWQKMILLLLKNPVQGVLKVLSIKLIRSWESWLATKWPLPKVSKYVNISSDLSSEDLHHLAIPFLGSVGADMQTYAKQVLRIRSDLMEEFQSGSLLVSDEILQDVTHASKNPDHPLFCFVQSLFSERCSAITWINCDEPFFGINLCNINSWQTTTDISFHKSAAWMELHMKHEERDRKLHQKNI